MAIDIVDIDHAMIGVRDVERAAFQFERLGFTVAPASDLPGMRNRCVCLTPVYGDAANYVELLGFTDRALAPPFMENLLGGPDGVVSSVVGVADCRAAEVALRAGGFDPGATIDMRRAWPLASGQALDVSFSICLPAWGRAPLYWNPCQHRTVQHYHRAEWRAHANGAARLRAILAVDDNPRAIAARYVEDWGATPTLDERDAAHVRARDVELRVLTPRRFGEIYGPETLPRARKLPAYAGLSIEVMDRARLVGTLSFNGVGFTLGDDHVLVAPGQACGALVEFTAP